MHFAKFHYPNYKVPTVSQKLSDDQISKLNTKKCGYGQGLRLDKNNRPYGALDFNSAFSKYNSFAIKEDQKKVIYLTFDQGYENGYTAKILDALKNNEDIINQLQKTLNLSTFFDFLFYSTPIINE